MKSLENRRILIDWGNVPQTMCCVPQESALESTLFNIYYDGIFTVDIPKGLITIGYAGGFASLARAKN